jgi:hypothetical protein
MWKNVDWETITVAYLAIDMPVTDMNRFCMPRLVQIIQPIVCFNNVSGCVSGFGKGSPHMQWDDSPRDTLSTKTRKDTCPKAKRIHSFNESVADVVLLSPRDSRGGVQRAIMGAIRETKGISN